MRRPKTDRVPRTRAGNNWTEAGFWGFLRSGFRQMSTRWPPLSDVLKARRREYHGPNKRQKYEYQCEQCEQWFPQAKTIGGKRKALVHVDHIEECGTLKSFDDVQGFMERLFCEADGLRVLCESCHQSRTNQVRSDVVRNLRT